MKNTKAELQKVIKQTAKVQHAYDIQKFSLLPLLDPQAINCYYFRNKNGLLFGELEPYFTTSDNEIAVDYTNYWSGWKKQLPNFHVMDVDSSNHMMFLSESKVSETISDFCENLYSEEGITENFLKSFKRKTKRKHGTLDLKTIKSKNEKNKREQEAKNLSGKTLKNRRRYEKIAKSNKLEKPSCGSDRGENDERDRGLAIEKAARVFANGRFC